ncbi:MULTISPECIES: hypothetical protein [Aeromonas]|uniref:Uncharacterized protein n=1 Tax=Aeromonas veronii TaxID=654 RepID=A0A2T4N0T2_AERVE|nr:hypothetical protein [Aeromonas veronii]PTH80424.1 hypothetical protein DAA48_14225 [Aeromonas veronii]QMS74755.1 hypothetical protein M001_011500 [Aeromonas veronii Hm21]RDE59186.1 hypothetical protein DV708_22865 [Aeromonas veronii]
MIPKELIKDITFDFDETETKCGPHIAFTLPSQGGAASGLNNSYLFKSENISEDTIKEAEEIKKAMLAQKVESLQKTTTKNGAFSTEATEPQLTPVVNNESTTFLDLFRAYKNKLKNNN